MRFWRCLVELFVQDPWLKNSSRYQSRFMDLMDLGWSVGRLVPQSDHWSEGSGHVNGLCTRAFAQKIH